MRGLGFAVTAGVCMGLGMVAVAEPVTGTAAKGMLFSREGAAVEVLAQDFLTEADVKALQLVGAAQRYYGAIAVSPDEGLMVEATVAAANYHDTDAASAAAKAECDAKRKGAAPCAVVALIRPKSWEAQALQLSADATEGFRKDYRGQGPKALAISPATGLWGIATGEGAAIAACAAKAAEPATDCTIAVAD